MSNTSDFFKTALNFNTQANPKARTQKEAVENVTINSTGGSVYTGATNSEVKTNYSSMGDLLSGYSKNGKLDAEGVAHMKADFEAGNINKINVGKDTFNIIDADKQGNTVNDTKGNDIIFGAAKPGLKTYNSTGGKDLLLSPSKLDNSVTVLGFKEDYDPAFNHALRSLDKKTMDKILTANQMDTLPDLSKPGLDSNYNYNEALDVIKGTFREIYREDPKLKQAAEKEYIMDYVNHGKQPYQE